MSSMDEVAAAIKAQKQERGERERERERLIQRGTKEEKLATADKMAKRRAKKLKSVDVCFVADATASMEKCLNMVAQKAEEIGTYICQKMGEGTSVRVACVAYRDYGDEGHPQVFPFTNELSEVRSFMNSLEADGGGDVCEDLLGGLQAATELTWTSKTRLLFLLPQTEQHGRRFHEALRPCCDEDTLRSIIAKSDLPVDKHDEVLDRMILEFYDLYPEDPRQWEPMDTTIARLQKLEVSLVCLTMNNPLERMLGVVRRLYDEASVGLSLKVMSMDLDPAKFCSLVTSASVEAVSSSMSRSRSSIAATATTRHAAEPLQLQPLQVTPRADAAWENRESWCHSEVTIIRYDVRDLDNPILSKPSERRVSINPIPFGQGQMRMAFYVFDEDHSFKLVGKVYRFTNEEFQLKKTYEGDMHTQAVSRYLARKFTERYPEEPIEFVAAELLDLGANSPLPFCRYMALEPWIPGTYDKFTNNGAYISKDSEVAQAFSHFTFDFSDEDIMVVDIQGDAETKTFTDPQIHCDDDRFGIGNFGTLGKDQFFAVHRCNAICDALKLKKHPCQMEGVCAACQEASADQKPAHEAAPEPIREPAVASKVDTFLSEARRDAAGLRAAAAAAEEEEVAGACLRWLEEPRVVRVRPGSAAHRAGIRPDSCIGSVGDQRIKGMPREQVLQLLEAPDNVPVFRWPEEVLLKMAREMAEPAGPPKLDLADLLEFIGMLGEVAEGGDRASALLQVFKELDVLKDLDLDPKLLAALLQLASEDKTVKGHRQQAINLFITKASADAREAQAKAESSGAQDNEELAGATLAWEHPPRVVGVAPGSPAEALGLRGGEVVVKVGGKDVKTLGRAEILALMQHEDNGWEVCQKAADRGQAAAQGTTAPQQPFAPPARPRTGDAATPEAASSSTDPGADKAAPPQAARPATDLSTGEAALQQALEHCRAQPTKMRQKEHLCSGKCGKRVTVDSADWVSGGQRAFCTECKVKREATQETRPCSTHSCDGQIKYSKFEYTAMGLDPPKFCRACRVRMQSTGSQESFFLRKG